MLKNQCSPYCNHVPTDIRNGSCAVSVAMYMILFMNIVYCVLLANMVTFERNCCMRGYHLYQHIWDAVVREHLNCEREPRNSNDRYAVAVVEDEIVVGHLLRKVSCLCSLFLRKGGRISCIVTGIRRYSADLPQGGLEVSCKLFFTAQS